MANVPYLVPGDVWNLFLTLLEGSQVPSCAGKQGGEGTEKVPGFIQ